MKKVIIVGNGPAGVSAALYTVRAGIETIVMGNGSGSLVKADKIENYYGFHEPVSGSDLIDNGLVQAARLGVEIVKEEVVDIRVSDDQTDRGSFFVRTHRREYISDAIILATGASRTAPPIQGLQELEGQGVSYCAICDGFFYRGKDVAVLGSGEYALNEAKELLPLANSVTLLTNGATITADFPPEIRIKQEKILSINAGPENPFLGGPGPLESVTLADQSQLMLSGIFVAYGTAGSSALAKKIGAFSQGNKIIVNPDMSTNIPGFYAAGDCIGGLLQISKAVSDGAIAGTSVVKYLRK